jgi:hypothetical protein
MSPRLAWLRPVLVTLSILLLAALERPGADRLREWAHRLRQQVRVALTPIPDWPWQLVVWDEIFFHLNTTGEPGNPRTGYPSQTGFDQNRLFLGVAYQPTASVRVELGYLNQVVNRMDRPPDQINHALSLSVAFSLATLSQVILDPES